MLVRGDGYLGRLCVIFAGQGRLKNERSLYHPDIAVLFHRKAWNAATQLAYDELVLLPEFRAAGIGSGRAGHEVEGLAFSDNLSAHK